MANHNFRRTGAVVPSSGGCGAPPSYLPESQIPAECSATSRSNMRTVMGVEALAVAAGATATINITTLERFRIESLKVGSSTASDFVIESINLGNTPATPSQAFPIPAETLSEVSTDVCLRWPDIRPELPASMTVRNISNAQADFRAMFTGWMNPV